MDHLNFILLVDGFEWIFPQDNSWTRFRTGWLVSESENFPNASGMLSLACLLMRIPSKSTPTAPHRDRERFEHSWLYHTLITQEWQDCGDGAQLRHCVSLTNFMEWWKSQHQKPVEMTSWPCDFTDPNRFESLLVSTDHFQGITGHSRVRYVLTWTNSNSCRIWIPAELYKGKLNGVRTHFRFKQIGQKHFLGFDERKSNRMHANVDIL